MIKTMNTRSILVDIDETTAGLMEQINNDFVSDVKRIIEESVAQVKNKLNQQLEDLSTKTSADLGVVRDLAKKQSKDLEEISDTVYDIEEILKEVKDLDRIVGASSNLNVAIESVKSELQESERSIHTAINSSKSECMAAYDAISSCISKGTADSVSQHLQLKDSVSQATSSIESKISESQESLAKVLETVNARLAAMDTALRQIEKRVDESEASLKSDFDSKINNLLSRTDKLLAKMDEVEMKESNRHSESKSLLEKILYLSTPFWNRKKLQKNEI